MLEEVEAVLDNSVDADALKSQIRATRRDFELDDDPTRPKPIGNFDAFRDALESLVCREVNEVQQR